MKKLINGRPMGEIKNANSDRIVAVHNLGAVHLLQVNFGDSCAFNVSSGRAVLFSDYQEWAEIVKPDPKPDANGWWCFKDKHPECGMTVQLVNKNGNREIGWERHLVKIKGQCDFSGSWSHWKPWEGPIS